MTTDKALDLALEALEESVDLVREDYENAKKLYSNYPSRQARLLGLEDGLSKHEAAITAIKQARALDKKAENARELGLDYEPHKGLSEHLAQVTNGRVRIDPVTGDVGIGTPPAQPAPVQSAERGEPVAFFCPSQGFYWAKPTKIIAPVTVDFKPLPLYTTPPAAQRQFVGLTDEEKRQIFVREGYQGWLGYINAIEAKLKEKNNG